MDARDELHELEERNKTLQAALDRIMSAEQESKSEKEFLDAKAGAVRQELAAARVRNERAAQIRNTCKRLSSLEGKLHPGGHRGATQAHPETKTGVVHTLAQVATYCLGFAVCLVLSLLAYTYVDGDPEQICRPPAIGREQPEHVSTQAFDPDLPPLMSQGLKRRFLVNESKLVTWGEAALHVCSKGTSAQSFLRRDDCDGCLCPLGSLWMQYKDPRFFGNGEFCVPEKQWKDCISRWSCCKNKPNYCWDFIFDGARQDPKSEDYCVVVDTCSQHMSCYSMIRRQRRWELISELRPVADEELLLDVKVGVPLAQIEVVNKTLNMKPDIRGWGMPSSVLQLIKVTPTTAPQEWEPEQMVTTTRKLAGGKRHKVWQLVSYFTISAKSMDGQEHIMAEFKQREFITYLDSIR